jgi:hypothetical protein
MTSRTDGVDQKCSEDEEDPAETVDSGGADRNESAAQPQCQDDAHEQREVLQARRDLELRHDDQEDEEVVHREAVLGQPARIELSRIPRAGRPPDTEPEDEGQADEYGNEKAASFIVGWRGRRPTKKTSMAKIVTMTTTVIAHA